MPTTRFPSDSQIDTFTSVGPPLDFKEGEPSPAQALTRKDASDYGASVVDEFIAERRAATDSQ